MVIFSHKCQAIQVQAQAHFLLGKIKLSQVKLRQSWKHWKTFQVELSRIKWYLIQLKLIFKKPMSQVELENALELP